MTWKPDYTTTSAVKAYLRISDTDDDAQLAVFITAASRAIDKWCGRQFGVVAALETREYEGKWDPSIGKTVYEIDDVMDIDDMTVVVTSDASDITDYELWPLNADKKGRPFTQLRTSATKSRLTVDALWGWTAIPSEVVNATLLQVARLAARRDSPYGVAGSPSDGSEARLLASVDPDVKVVLDDLKRKWWAA